MSERGAHLVIQGGLRHRRLLLIVINSLQFPRAINYQPSTPPPPLLLVAPAGRRPEQHVTSPPFSREPSNNKMLPTSTLQAVHTIVLATLSIVLNEDSCLVEFYKIPR